LGTRTLKINTTGSTNLAIGRDALLSNTTASNNLAIGDAALQGVITGTGNVGVGWGALLVASGSHNTALGFNAGSNVQGGSDNIHIGHVGVTGDNGVIRIGTAGTQGATFIAGISGVTTGGLGTAVVVDGSGQLGTISSSRTVKEDIADMGDASALLMKLRPVTFRYRNRPGWPLQYGLIAEEVAEVAPDLAAHGPDGKIQTVYYQDLPPMLLNEYQKQQHVIEAQQRQLDALAHELAELKARLVSR
jgi:hypothetical protein